MPTTNGNRKILDLKRWEKCTDAPAATGAAHFIVSSRHYKQQQLLVQSNTSAFLYNPSEDGWIAVPSPALTGTFGAGACGVAGAISTGTTVGAASLTATGGTTSTIVTNQTFARDLRGYSVHIVSGPNAGLTIPIVSNTIGANATITVATQASAFSASTVYRLLTPVYYVLGAGALAAGIFRKYDFATNTWTSLSQTNLPATIGTDSRLLSTPSWLDDNYVSFSNGTTSSATGTTLVDSTKSWTVNGFSNYQVRIVSGTGAGQIRSITSNTATALTVPTWTITPDATSVYVIEGNDDYLYYIGSNAVTLYRYSVSTNTWSTITPTVARGGAPGAGMSGHWIWGCTEPDWTDQNTGLNGRYIYSFRANSTALLDRYDIALNTWSAITYSPAVETFTTGTKWVYIADALYIHKDATGRWFRFDIPRANMDGWTTQVYPGGAAVLGDTAFDVTYHDGATDITYVYYILNTSAIMLRQMVI